MAREEELINAVQLIRGQRWAILATAEDNTPYVSAVAYAHAGDLAFLLLLLSRIASHTGRLSKNPNVAILISEPDDGRPDPQTLARLSISGRVEHVPRDNDQYPLHRKTYLDQLPESERLFNFSDFELFRVLPADLRYVGGFARAFTFSGERLRQAAAGST